MVALADQTRALESLVDSAGDVAPGHIAVSRFMGVATCALLSRPRFARAVLRAASSGTKDTTVRLSTYRSHLGALLGALIGADDPFAVDMLLDVWFAALLRWAGGLSSAGEVLDHLSAAARHLIPEGTSAAAA